MRLAHVFYIQAVVTALALCVVWQGSLARKIGYRQEVLSRRIELRAAEGKEYRAQISRLKSPQRILYLVDSLALNLTHPGAGPGDAASGSSSDPDGDASETSRHVVTVVPSH